MRRAAALALALLLLAGCGGAERAPVAAETAAEYALESFELSGIPAVSGGAVYDCAGGAEHAALCLHKIGGGCESFEPDWPGEVTGMGATESGVNLKYRDRGEVKFANLSIAGALTPGVGGGPGAAGAGDAHAGAYG